MSSRSSSKPVNPFKAGDKVNLPSFRGCYASFECSLKNLGEPTILAPSPAYKLSSSNDNNGKENEIRENDEERDLTLVSLNTTCSYEEVSPKFEGGDEEEEEATITPPRLTLLREEEKERGKNVKKTKEEMIKEMEEEEGEASPTTFNDVGFTSTRPSPFFHRLPSYYDNYSTDNNYHYSSSANGFNLNKIKGDVLEKELSARKSIEDRVSAIIPPLDNLERSGDFAYYQPKLFLHGRISPYYPFSSFYSPPLRAGYPQRPLRSWKKTTSPGNDYLGSYWSL